MKIILSTLTGAQDYVFYDCSSNAVNKVCKTIHIEGGSNLANKNLVTPQGVVTEISDDDCELLKTHPIFKLHFDNGFVKIVDSEKETEKAKQDLQKEDLSAPLTPSSYAKKGKNKPKAG